MRPPHRGGKDGMTITLYGIPNCDTVKKARTWLDKQGIAYAFHDYKKEGVTTAKVKGWCKALGWEVVLNRAGTTFRKLPDDAKADLTQAKAIALMVGQPSMIKRPIVEHDGGLLIGFKQPEWEAAFGT
jgi:arsenate reductase (glutaredoxin)